MGYDEIIHQLGEFGPYQKQIYVLLCLPSILVAFHVLAGVFIQASPNHRCLLSFENVTDATFEFIDPTIWDLFYPIDSRGGYSSCKFFHNSSSSSAAAIPDIEFLSSKSCDRGWVFDKSIYKSTTVTDWNMVCGDNWLRALADSLFMIGVMLGSIVFGNLSDKIGRKPVFVWSLVVLEISGLLVALSPQYIFYAASRFIVGAATSGIYVVAYILALEMVGPTYRNFAGTCYMFFFAAGYILTAVFAYYFRDWRTLQLALTLPGLIFMCYYWIIPESVRWLIGVNKKQEALKIIKKAAKVNGVSFSEDIRVNICSENSNNNTTSAFDMFRNPNLRKKSLVIFFEWFVNSVAYYGLSWNAGSLGGNYFINFIISGAVEIPAYIFLLLTMGKWGRRTLLVGSMTLAGTVLILTAFVPKTHNWLLITLTMLGKLATTGSFTVVYMFSAEQFPTIIRNTGMGVAATVGKLGGAFAPFCILLSNYWKPFPMVIFGEYKPKHLCDEFLV